jgi:moderate conductance mechanosensitive channel
MPTPLLATHVLAALPAQTVDPKVEACGPTQDQSVLCSVVFRITDNEGAAEVADRFATPVRILLIVVVAYVLVRVARFLIKRIVERLQSDDSQQRSEKLRRRMGLSLLDTSPTPQLRRVQRAETIGAVLRSLASILIWATALITILSEVGVDLTALVAGAGIIGVALGFGAQSVVRDFLAGLFMLIEDQFGVGDVIDAGEATGTVEGVSLRTTRLRDVSGVVWHIPNGEIKRIGNQSQQWSRAVLDIPVTYDTDVTTAMDVIKRVADEMWNDPQYKGVMLDEPEVWGVEELRADTARFGPDRMLIRMVAKTRPKEQWNVSRELRARIKVGFDEAGIDVPNTP